MDWNNYYMEQAGGGLDYNYFRGNVYQKGYGLGGTFRRFFKWVIPLIKTHAVPKIESGFKSVGREFLTSAANIATDVVNGRDLKESARENVNNSINTVKNRIENSLIGSGKKRKAKSQKSIKANKKFKKFVILKNNSLENYSNDIFD